MDFLGSPQFQGGVLAFIMLAVYGCMRCLSQMRDDIKIMRINELRRTAQESKLRIQDLEREIAEHDARTARNNT